MSYCPYCDLNCFPIQGNRASWRKTVPDSKYGAGKFQGKPDVLCQKERMISKNTEVTPQGQAANLKGLLLAKKKKGEI